MNFGSHYNGQGYLDIAKKMTLGFKPQTQPPSFKKSVSEKSLPDEVKPLSLKDKLKLEPEIFKPETPDTLPMNNGKHMFYYSENVPQFSRKVIYQLY